MLKKARIITMICLAGSVVLTAGPPMNTEERKETSKEVAASSEP